MGSLSDHVTVVVTADSLSVARIGYGGILILSATAAFGERVRKYNRLSDVADDFDTDDPEYLAANAAFSQNPRPNAVYIGRSVNKPTLAYVLDIALVENDKLYVIDVEGPGITSTTVEYQADSSATEAEIRAGLTTALNAVVGNNYTAVDTGTTITVTGDAAGDWFSLAVDPTYITSWQTQADPGVAADLIAINNENSDWYYLYTLYNSEPYASAAATWAAANRKMYIVQSSDTRDLGTSTGTAGLLDYLAASGRTRTAGDYHPDPSQFAGMALLGNIAPRDPGSWTAKWKFRDGITPVVLTGTQRTNLVARHANFYEQVRGVNITSEGTTSAGPTNIRGFIDNVVSIDATEDDIAVRVFTSLAGVAKLPRTDEGMIVIENDLTAALDFAVQRKIAAPGSTAVEIPDIEEMDDLLPRGVRAGASMKLAGAIHGATVNFLVVT